MLVMWLLWITVVWWLLTRVWKAYRITKCIKTVKRISKIIVKRLKSWKIQKDQIKKLEDIFVKLPFLKNYILWKHATKDELYKSRFAEKVPDVLKKEKNLQAWINKNWTTSYYKEYIEQKFWIKIIEKDGKNMFKLDWDGEFMNWKEFNKKYPAKWRKFLNYLKKPKAHEVMHRILGSFDIKKIELELPDGTTTILTQEEICHIIDWSKTISNELLTLLNKSLKQKLGYKFNMLKPDGSIDNQAIRRFDTKNLESGRDFRRLRADAMAEERLIEKVDFRGKSVDEIKNSINKEVLKTDESIGKLLDEISKNDKVIKNQNKLIIHALHLIYDIKYSPWLIKRLSENITIFTENWKVDYINKWIYELINIWIKYRLKSWEELKMEKLTNFLKWYRKIVIDYKWKNIKKIRAIEKRLQIIEINKAIKKYGTEKVYKSYEDNIWKLHAGKNSETWENITIAIRDINLVKWDWLKELEQFITFVAEIKKKWFNNELLEKYYKWFIDDYISFLKSHIRDKNQELNNIRNNKWKYWLQFKLLKDFITNLI